MGAEININKKEARKYLLRLVENVEPKHILIVRRDSDGILNIQKIKEYDLERPCFTWRFGTI